MELKNLKRGVDVSIYQGEIDWMLVRSDGIDFAMVKATQGRSEINKNVRLFEDKYFRQNVVKAYSSGLRCGVWHYLTARNLKEAEEESRFFIQRITPYKQNIQLYAAVDVESKYLPKNKKLLTEIVNLFCDIVSENGFKPAVYTSPWYMRDKMYWSDIDYPLWMALHREQERVPEVSRYPGLKIWQQGVEQVKGITTEVDYNFMIVDDFKKPDPNPLNAQEELWDAMKWISDNGIMKGNENGDMMTEKEMTRGEFAMMLKRYHDKM